MAEKIRISPVTRINGFWRLDVHVENGKVVDAYSSGIYVRGIEEILKKRDPQDAVYLSQRICGICSSAHALAGSLAVEKAYNLTIPPNGVIIRNLIFGSDLLQNHIRHFYFLTLPDFALGPEEPPFIPRYEGDYRLSPRETEQLFDHYMESIKISRLCHEMLVVFGGKVPHNHGIVIGGATVPPTADRIRLFLSRLHKIQKFIIEKMLPDVELLADRYADYYQIGQGPKNLLTYGMFPREDQPGQFYFQPAIVENGKIKKLEPEKIHEQVKYSWYKAEDETDDIMKATTHLAPNKEGAYSWIKAPRYQNKVVQMGPFVRMWVTNKYQHGISTMDRTMGRALEAKTVAELMEEWVLKLETGKPIYQEHNPVPNFRGIGLMEAMRGALGHWIEVENSQVKTYQVITPSSWNMSPRDDQEKPGAIEQALIGIPIADNKNPIEVGRVARSFDPCSSCAAQIYIPDQPIQEYIIQ